MQINTLWQYLVTRRLDSAHSVAVLWFLTPDLWFSRDKFDHIQGTFDHI